jgi:exopolysaccharide biosynthesis polyprenyl glycosylphosphotransferase
VFSRQHRKTRPLFILADILLIWLSFEAAYAIRSSLALERQFYLLPPTKALLILAYSLFSVLAALWVGAYDSILRSRFPVLLSLTLRQCGVAAAALVMFEYLQRVDLSRPFMGLLFMIGFVALVAFRLLARLIAPFILGADSAKRFVYVVGTGEVAVRIARMIEDSEPYGLCLLGFLDQHHGVIHLRKEFPVHPLDTLPEILRRLVVDEIVFAVDTQRLGEMEDTFLVCEEEGVRTRVHLDFFPHIHSRVGLERLEGEPMLTFAGAPHDEVRLLVKRGQDLILALVSLLVLSPLMLLIALLIRLTSRGPALFRQERCGLNGRRFRVVKFRTMVVDAEARKAEVAHLNVKTTAFKIPNDPRLTGVGRWLRKFSLDELPQLLNIVRGEMAIVGPRPPVPEEVANYERWQRRRLRMRPGLTCLWALEGRDALDFDSWMRLDLKYIDEWSLWLDWVIILRTIPHVLLGRGAN